MTPILSFVCLRHTPPLNSSQEPLITKAKRSYLKVAQQGPADSRGRKGGGTGRAQQAWPLPEASKGASGKRRGMWVGPSSLDSPISNPWTPLFATPQGSLLYIALEKMADFCLCFRGQGRGRIWSLTASGDGHLSASAPWDCSLLGPMVKMLRKRLHEDLTCFGIRTDYKLSEEHLYRSPLPSPTLMST